jgi:hypothetical protein
MDKQIENEQDEIFNKLIEELGITEISADTLKQAKLGHGLIDQVNSIIDGPAVKKEIH